MFQQRGGKLISQNKRKSEAMHTFGTGLRQKKKQCPTQKGARPSIDASRLKMMQFSSDSFLSERRVGCAEDLRKEDITVVLGRRKTNFLRRCDRISRYYCGGGSLWEFRDTEF